MTREHIVSEIKRTAAENGGVPLGSLRFQRETGIRKMDWYGRYWIRWSDALRDAGYAPNAWQAAIPQDELVKHLALLAREVGRFPLEGDLRMKSRQDKTFPAHSTFRRLGSKTDRVAHVVSYCTGRHGFEDVVALCTAVPAQSVEEEQDDSGDRAVPMGYVYLLRSGRHYKLGKTNAFGRRERELAIQLPDRAHTVHVIRTDDPTGIEEYWHKRFAAKRRNGEWFELDAEDVKAFKRRKFM